MSTLAMTADEYSALRGRACNAIAADVPLYCPLMDTQSQYRVASDAVAYLEAMAREGAIAILDSGDALPLADAVWVFLTRATDPDTGAAEMRETAIRGVVIAEAQRRRVAARKPWWRRLLGG